MQYLNEPNPIRPGVCARKGVYYLVSALQWQLDIWYTKTYPFLLVSPLLSVITWYLEDVRWWVDPGIWYGME